MDDFVKLLDAISRLLAAAVLPVVVFTVFWVFRKELNALIRRTNSVTFKGAGVDIAITAQQAQAAGALAAAVASRPQSGQDAHATARTAEAAASLVTEAVTPEVVQRASTSTVLWVDDNPDNNIYERRSLEALGVRIVLATSTDEALKQARQQRFEAVISDLARGLDRTAGYTLLQQLRAAGIDSPFIIYAGSADATQRASAKQRGAVDATNRPDELFQLVLAALQGQP